MLIHVLDMHAVKINGVIQKKLSENFEKNLTFELKFIILYVSHSWNNPGRKPG